jgi:hypothetical protein
MMQSKKEKEKIENLTAVFDRFWRMQRDPSDYKKMAHDPYCLEERIISDLQAVMKKDPNL